MGIRTPGLLIANETLYQLSYTPRPEIDSYYGSQKSASKWKEPSLPSIKCKRE
jgi:hypothetical protein